MKQDTEKTKVLFLIERDEPKTIFAYFPEMVHNGEVMTCYAHIGQHSACHPDYAKGCKEAKYYQYSDLLKELVSIGYNLEVLNDQTIEYHRQPTMGEIRFGEGAIHYRSFNIGEVLNNKGGFKKWFVADDNLRYYR